MNPLSSPSRPDRVAVPPGTGLSLLDAGKLLAFVGDLGMGQPVDHSMRTACIAQALALGLGCGAVEAETAQYLGLLRWSGCTANAAQFSEMLGDDVLGRARLLSTSLSSAAAGASPGTGRLLLYAIRVHCEVAVQIATTMDDASAAAVLI